MIDGADEIDGARRAIKGGGGALLREKIVGARRADGRRRRFEKSWSRGSAVSACPIECSRSQAAFVETRGDRTRCRARTPEQESDATPFLTDQGNYVFDLPFASIPDQRSGNASRSRPRHHRARVVPLRDRHRLVGRGTQVDTLTRTVRVERTEMRARKTRPLRMTLGRANRRPRHAGRRPALLTAYYTLHPTHPCPSSGWPSAPRAIAAQPSVGLQRGHILAITHAIVSTGASRIDGPLFLGIDTHALSDRPSRPTGGWLPTESRCYRDRTVTRRSGDLARDPHLQPQPHARAGRRHRGKPSHNPPEDAASSSIRRAVVPPTPWDGLDPGARQCAAGQWSEGSETDPDRRARRASTTHYYDYLGSYVGDLASVVDSNRSAVPGRAGRRSPGRRRDPLLGAIADPLATFRLTCGVVG